MSKQKGFLKEEEEENSHGQLGEVILWDINNSDLICVLF